MAAQFNPVPSLKARNTNQLRDKLRKLPAQCSGWPERETSGKTGDDSRATKMAADLQGAS